MENETLLLTKDVEMETETSETIGALREVENETSETIGTSTTTETETEVNSETQRRIDDSEAEVANDTQENVEVLDDFDVNEMYAEEKTFQPATFCVCYTSTKCVILIRSIPDNHNVPLFVRINEESVLNDADGSEINLNDLKIFDSVSVLDYDPKRSDQCESEIVVDFSSAKFTFEWVDKRATQVNVVTATLQQQNPISTMMSVVERRDNGGQRRDSAGTLQKCYKVHVTNVSDAGSHLFYVFKSDGITVDSVVEYQRRLLPKGTYQIPCSKIFIPAVYKLQQLKPFGQDREQIVDNSLRQVATRSQAQNYYANDGIDAKQFPNAVDQLLHINLIRAQRQLQAEAEKSTQSVTFSEVVTQNDDYMAKMELDYAIGHTETEEKQRETVVKHYKEGAILRLDSDSGYSTQVSVHKVRFNSVQHKLEVWIKVPTDRMGGDVRQAEDWQYYRWQIGVAPQCLLSTSLKKSLTLMKIGAALQAKKPTHAQQILLRLMGKRVNENESYDHRPIKQKKVPSELIQKLRDNLNESRQIAVIEAVQQPQHRLIAVQAPPGSGKTRTATAVAQLLQQQQQLTIVTAAQNIVVNQLASMIIPELSDTSTALVIQSAAQLAKSSVNDELHSHRFDVQFLARLRQLRQGESPSDQSTLERAAQMAIHRLKQMSDYTSTDKRLFTSQDRATVKDFRFAIELLMKKANVTVVFITYDFLTRYCRAFTRSKSAVLIDEASTIPLYSFTNIVNSLPKLVKVVCIGDTRQLGVELIGLDENLKTMLDKSILDAAVQNGDAVIHLDVMFRSLRCITNSVAAFSYPDQTITCKMPDSASSPLVDALYRCPGPSFKPIVLVDCEGIEEKTISLSFANTEQEVIAMRLYRVIKTLNPNSSVLIVSTYSAAKIRLQQNGVPTADVVTVDQSQGKEADVVIVVSVITKHASSFFTKKQRLNVMTSRAKTSMFIVGKMKWLSTQKNWTKLISLWKDPKVGNAIEINAKRLLVVEDWMSGAFNQIYEFPPKEIDAAGVGEEVEYDPEQPFHSLRSYFLHLDDPDSGTTSEASEDESESEDSSDEDDSQEKHQRTSAHLESTSSRFGKRKHENEPVQIEYVSSAKSSKHETIRFNFGF